jgi:hypothetical protein
MGREVRRVPVDFDWPLEKIWEGFLNPLGGFPACPDCSYEQADTLMDKLFPNPHKSGTGLTPAAYAIDQTFYSHQIESAVGNPAHFGRNDRAEQIAWHDKLGQAEVDNLVAEGRLRVWEDGKWISVPRTADEVNAENRRGGLGAHDAINRWILIRFRCKVLGIEMACPTCKGKGDIATDEQRKAYDEWEPTPPPTGDGWQVWETVSEGSPITPVFATKEGLIDYLVEKGTTWDQKSGSLRGGPWRREAAEKFVEAEWAPSGVGIEGVGFFDGARDADKIADAGKR